MARIHTLKITNFRGIQNFEQTFGDENFVCLIGRGDSGKTTILDAIALVLSSNWNVAFFDTDFFNCNVNNPIMIEASLTDPPDYLLQDKKFGMYLRGLDLKTNIIHDDLTEDHEDVLTIRLTVTKELEPIWEVISGRQEPVEIKSSDRSSFNVFPVSDYIDKHFSWGKGSPLYSLLQQSETQADSTNVIIGEMRKAKDHIDESSGFDYLQETVDKVINAAAKMGAVLSGTNTTIDSKELNIKDGKVCLHDDEIPFRLKGKGSKRLISIAIQTELAKAGGILLIDEIEQGLEPDRVQHLAKILKSENTSQVFITTHSRDVLVELEANNLFRMKKRGNSLFAFNAELQGLIRSNPEAFFADRIIVCEGATEIGFCRGVNKFRISFSKSSTTLKGIRLANGAGSKQTEYAEGFSVAGYDVCMLCDSDVKSVNEKKESFRQKGIHIIDTDDNYSLEDQLFNDLNWDAILELIQYRQRTFDIEHIKQQVAKYHSSPFPVNAFTADSKEMRIALAKASTEKGKEWFKRTDHGEFVGERCCHHKPDFSGKTLYNQLESLDKWIDDV